METMIPLNGRIAIVDDQIEQALPLMRVFAKNNIPYVYYKGNDVDYLPEQPENDIRILFLDLNLLDGRDNQPKEIRSTLFSAISHIISSNNYPYLLILWSRQEKEYKGLLEDLFANDLKDCSPIAILDWIKSDFFPNFSDEEENKENEYKILDELKKVLVSMPAYSYLMQWENCVHNSADATIQDIFHDYHSHDNWQNNANCIIDMFAKSYLEKHYNDDISQDVKVRASLEFLNEVFQDTLESNVACCIIPNATDLKYNVSEENQKDIAAKINGCLLLSNQLESLHQPGCLIRLELDSDSVEYHKLLDNSLRDLPNKIKIEDICQYLVSCAVVVTPACDYAQKKVIYDRIVEGVIIDSDYEKYVDDSEAIYKSPRFTYESRNRILVLNFRYFITANIESINSKPIFRLRNTILAEIQSKLARHISRQGVMNL